MVNLYIHYYQTLSKMKTAVEKVASCDGMNINYKEKNGSSTQSILCLHALGHSLKDYEHIFEEEAFDNYRIIAIDFPGHGGSSNGDEPVSSAYYAVITQKLIRQLNMKNVIILGNSIGGAVAMRLASDPANNIVAIQLANPAGLDKGGLVSKWFLSFMTWFFKKGVSKHPKFGKWFKYYYHKVLPSPEAAERRGEIIDNAYSIAPILAEGWSSFKLESENLKDVAARLSCPVLVTWAMKDKKVQYRRNIQAVKQINRLELIKYNVGHTPILENSKQFLEDLKKFLDRCSSVYALQ